MEATEIITTTHDFTPAKLLVLDSVYSPNTKRSYSRAIDNFLAWLPGSGYIKINRAAVQRYRSERLGDLSPNSANQHVTAIKKLATEAAYNGLLDPVDLAGIKDVKGIQSGGVRSGNWLTREEAQQLLEAPDTSTLKGLRDRALLAVMVGCGLRRAEVASLTFEHIQLREARWAIVDLVGKGKKTRTVPIPAWCKAAIDEWALAAGLATGRVFRGVHRFGKTINPESEGITPQSIYNAVAEYTDVAPHDLRRSFAKLSRKGGAELTQIQLTLGHSNAAITQQYIGEDLDLHDAPCDRLGLRLV